MFVPKIPARGPPRELNTKNATYNVQVSKDKLTLRYKGLGQHENDIGCIQVCLVMLAGSALESHGEKGLRNRRRTSRPRLTGWSTTLRLRCWSGASAVASPSDLLTVSSRSASSQVRMRLGSRLTVLLPCTHLARRLDFAGKERFSYGYYSEDGRLYHEEDKSRTYGPTFDAGDTVGAGIDLERGDIFFTRNGEYLGVALHRIRHPLYPTISVHSPGEAVRVNFGAQPFVFDLAALESELRRSRRQAIEGSRAATTVTIPQAHTCVFNAVALCVCL